MKTLLAVFIHLCMGAHDCEQLTRSCVEAETDAILLPREESSRIFQKCYDEMLRYDEYKKWENCRAIGCPND